MSVVQSTLLNATFTGHNGVGAISIPGLKVGDHLIFYDQSGTIYMAGGTGSFEWIVSVNDQLQQIVTTDYSAQTFKLVAYRGL